MFCEQCKVEIPPAWVRVIQGNICPACEGEIMSKATKELLDELTSAMERMPNDPEGLAGWLLSNYKLTKIGEAEPTEFHRKPNKKTDNGDVPKGLKIANNPVDEYLKRAGMDKQINKRKDLKAIADHINKVASGEIQDEMYPNPEQDFYDDVEEQEQVYNDQSQPLAKDILANNSLVVPSDQPNMKPLSSSDIIQMQKLVQIDPQADDNIPQILQLARMEKLKKQKASLEGTGPGKIKRSS